MKVPLHILELKSLLPKSLLLIAKYLGCQNQGTLKGEVLLYG